MARAPDALAALGVNTRAELAAAAAVLRDRINEAHMLAGVTIVDPASTWIDAGVELEADAVVHPFTVLRGSTTVAAGAEVGPHAVAVDATIGAGALVGPFCYLRPGTVLEAGAKAGTFVEIKNSRIGARTKVPHLSYIGDADIGEDTNIAAGNITANFSHEPGRPQGADDDRQQRQDRRRQYVRCSGRRSATMHGSGRERSSRTTSRRARWPGSRRGRRPRKDGSTSVETSGDD